tara:strand:- start:61 stop:900 length:840 start_codon:yes stop_codon:yes gene_type:complete
MKVSIIGYGFVGKALFNAIKKNVTVQKIDPKLNTHIKDLEKFRPNLIFISVPTPMNEDGTQNISILINIIEEIKTMNLVSLVVIKSTILPNYVLEIQNILQDLVYNPEFLREKHANEDFISSSLIVFGGTNKATKKLAEFYDEYLDCINKDYIFTDVVTAALVKYTINSFLATKVIFFNEIFQLFNASGSSESWKTFIKTLSRDPRIGHSHMNVPGHDKRFGFGGACLPKDSNAIVNYADSLEANLEILKTVIKINNRIRAKYNKNTDREDEQNIFFKD